MNNPGTFKHKKYRWPKDIRHVIMLFMVLLTGFNNQLLSQCEGGQNVPLHFIDLANIPEGFKSGEFQLGDECCPNMQGNNSCLYFDIHVGTAFVGLQMCFDPPCSIDGYYGAAPIVGDPGETFLCDGGGSLSFNPVDEIDLCKDIFCTPDPSPDTIRILVCKPGVANNPLGLDIIGIPEIVLEVGDVAVGCNTRFDLGGAVTIECGSGSSPPKIVPVAVAWSNTDGLDPNLNYLSCTNCVDPIFTYTGAPVMDCAGLKIDYTASIPFPPNDCSVPAPVTKTATIYPELGGELTVNRSCAACPAPLVGACVQYTFDPDLACPDNEYTWYNSSGVVQTPQGGEGLNQLTVVGDPNETYCVYVTRSTTPFCDPVVYCASAFCCDPLVGDNCWD